VAMPRLRGLLSDYIDRVIVAQPPRPGRTARSTAPAAGSWRPTGCASTGTATWWRGPDSPGGYRRLLAAGGAISLSAATFMAPG